LETIDFYLYILYHIHILENKEYRELMLTELAMIKEKLGQGGGSKNMADLAIQMLHI